MEILKQSTYLTETYTKKMSMMYLQACLIDTWRIYDRHKSSVKVNVSFKPQEPEYIFMNASFSNITNK